MSSVLCDKQKAAKTNDKNVDDADKKHEKRGIFGEGYGGGDYGGGDFGDFGGHDFGGHDEHHHHSHVHHEKTIVDVKKVKKELLSKILTEVLIFVFFKSDVF